MPTPTPTSDVGVGVGVVVCGLYCASAWGRIDFRSESLSIWLEYLRDETVIISVEIIRDILAGRSSDDLRDWVHAVFISHHQITLNVSSAAASCLNSLRYTGLQSPVQITSMW